MADYENQIRSEYDQLTSLGQYRDLLIEALNQADYPGIEDRVRSEFSFDHLNNPKILADFLSDLFSPHELISREMRSNANIKDGTGLLNSLLIINRTRNRVVNGAFDDNIDGWIDFSGSLGDTVHGPDGTLRLIHGGNAARARQSVSVQSGKRYFYSVDALGDQSTICRLGTSVDGSNLFNVTLAPGNSASTVVSSTTSIIGVSFRLTTTGTSDIDNVVVRRLDP